MGDDMLDGMGYIGGGLVFVFAITGAYIWLRYGWTGVAVIWAKRDEIANIVKQDLQETVFRG